MEMEVIPNAHNTSEGQSSFVERLEEIGENHDCQDAPINQPLEALVLLRMNLDGGSIGILCDFGINAAIVGVVLLQLIAGENALDVIDVSGLLDVLDVLPRVSTATQMRETEETLGRTADLYANIVELPLLKANPAIYDDLMRECEHLAGEVQIVMGGSLKR